MPQEPGQLINGKYRLIRPLARGGMGSVWVARHVDLDVEVALKFRRTEHELDPHAEDRFKREAQAAARLRSPHVVHIHDYGIDEGAPYIAMELLEGEDLGDALDRERSFSLERAIEVLRQAGKGLKLAHQAGIVHRDIKPSNLYLARHGDETTVKVLDFGIAKAPTPDRGTTTSAGLVLGSPAYMSPEQARAGSVDQRSDLWSLAAVFYRMVTGVPPFDGSNSHDIVVKLCTERVKAATMVAPRLPSEADRFFERALARAPEERFASVDELVWATEALGGDRSLDAGRPSSPLPLPGARFSDGSGRADRKGRDSSSGESAGRDSATASLMAAGRDTDTELAVAADESERSTITEKSRISRPRDSETQSVVVRREDSVSEKASRRRAIALAAGVVVATSLAWVAFAGKTTPVISTQSALSPEGEAASVAPSQNVSEREELARTIGAEGPSPKAPGVPGPGSSGEAGVSSAREEGVASAVASGVPTVDRAATPGSSGDASRGEKGSSAGFRTSGSVRATAPRTNAPTTPSSRAPSRGTNQPLATPSRAAPKPAVQQPVPTDPVFGLPVQEGSR